MTGSDENFADIGDRLRSARESVGIRIGKFAQLVGYSRPHLSAIETGRVKPSKALVMAYERSLGLPAGTLLLPYATADGMRMSSIKHQAGAERERLRDQRNEAIAFASLVTRAVDRLDDESKRWLIQATDPELRDPHLALRAASRQLAITFHAELGALPPDQQDPLRERADPLIPLPVNRETSIDLYPDFAAGGRDVEQQSPMTTILTPDDEELQNRVILTATFGDNQFVPASLARTIFAKAGSRYEPGLFDRIDKEIQSLLKLSLINGGSVLFNRAYFINNRSIFKNFLPEADSRDAFVELLNARAIIPWLYRESSADEIPWWFQVDPVGTDAWKRVLRDAPNAAAVRLSVDNTENDDLTRTLSERFHENVQNLYSRTIAIYFLELFGREPTGEEEIFFTELLMLAADVARASSWARRLAGAVPIVSREEIYRVFFSTKPADSIYDGGALLADDPGAALSDTHVVGVVDTIRAIRSRYSVEHVRLMLPAIKELIDLAYAIPLADMTGAFALTAPGSAERRALQEFRHAGLEKGASGAISPEHLLQMLEAGIFADVMRVLQPVGLDRLSLDDVVHLRATDEWTHFQVCLGNLIAKAPLVFQEEAHAVCTAYSDLLRKAPKGSGGWQLGIGISISAAGRELNAMWEGTKLIWNIRGKPDPRTDRKNAAASVQLVLGDVEGRGGWTSKMEYFKGMLPRANHAFDQIVDALDNQAERGKAQRGDVFWQHRDASAVNAPGDGA